MENKCVLILSQHFFGKVYTMLAREFHVFLYEEVYFKLLSNFILIILEILSEILLKQYEMF